MSQTVALGLLTNLGALAICALAITYFASQSRLSLALSPSMTVPTVQFGLILGSIFGATAALLIVLSVQVPSEAVLDLRAAPAILAGVFGGPVAAAVTFVMGAAARILLGGPWALGGVLSLLVFVLSGLLFRPAYRAAFGRELDIPGILLLSILATLAIIPLIFLLAGGEQGLELVSMILPILLVNNPLGVLLLGSALIVAFRILNDRERLAVMSAKLESGIAAERLSNERLVDTVSELETLIHTISHDLRGPLITLRGFLDVMEEARRDGDADGYAQARTRVVRGADAMESIVVSVLDHDHLARPVALTEEVSAKTLFEEVANMLGFSSDGPGPVAMFDGPDMSIRADAASVRQVILNAISNAMKHGRRAEALVVLGEVGRCQDADAGMLDVLTISDNGTTIPEDRRQDVFRRFCRLSEDAEGSGLGLAIVDKIARVHGGRAWITASPLGGTSVHIGFATAQATH